MFELSVMAAGGCWILHDDEGGELGRFPSRAAALAAASDYARVADESRMVLVRDDLGEWDEALVEPTYHH